MCTNRVCGITVMSSRKRGKKRVGGDKREDFIRTWQVLSEQKHGE